MTVILSNKFTVIATSESLSTNYLSASKIKNTIYKKYSPSELCDSVLDWVLQKKKTGLKSYCQNCNVPRTTIAKYLN